MAERSLTMFTWGYWGWGNATGQFVKAVDAVEAARGFKPPRFVDVRIHRSVRATGFQGAAFEKVVGERRHLWMPLLGNQAVLGKPGPRVQIKDPTAAETLLDEAVEAARQAQRLLFFCSCEFPNDCHRFTVADLLLKAAKARNVRLTVVEWPGGEPGSTPVDIELALAQLKQLRGGRRSIPLGRQPSLERYGAVPWASVARVHAANEELLAIIGPAAYRADGWCLPLLEPARSDATVEATQREALRIRRQFRFEPRTS